MIFIYVLFGFSLTKAFSDFFVTDKVDLKNSFACYRVLLQPLILKRRTRFMLNGVAFLFVNDVLDFWYSG